MNALELADELGNWYSTDAPREAAKMLRYQHREIGFWKQDADKYKLKCEQQQKLLKELGWHEVNKDGYVK